MIPSVVNITSKTVAYDFFYGGAARGSGSGFIIDKEGHILTNYHVVGDSSQLDVTLHNKKTYRATVIGRDRVHDLAVIQIKAPEVVPATLWRLQGAAGRAESVCHWQSLRTFRNDDARYHQLDEANP